MKKGIQISNMGIGLYDYQLEAIDKMRNGCILCGGVGTGKSRTSLGYYFKENGGKIVGNYEPMVEYPQDLYIITTAKKRDEKEWELDMAPFLISSNPEIDIYNHSVIVDSWNNITKYKEVKDSFFIFDEQRLVGKGTWVKTFLKISKNNNWILLTATPGDQWTDYIPVFVANGFYKNRTQFNEEHIVWSKFTKYPKITRYLNVKKLERLRDSILVDMYYKRKTTSHHENIYCDYDISLYKSLRKTRWNPFDNEPIMDAHSLCYLERKVANMSDDRQLKLLELYEKHPKAIIFYNFDYELDILKSIFGKIGVEYAEWNGHKHQPIPDTDEWVYFVQYTAGAEGWNCILTDTIIFYSQNYSYKALKQACGRIDRLNTPYLDLYYYHLKSHAFIDIAISRALSEKKDFNESSHCGKFKYDRIFNKEVKYDKN